jgi:hypothetical protein
MNDISKSIKLGTVDFFGIMIPGIIVIGMCIVGFFVPIAAIVIDLSQAQVGSIIMDTNGALLIGFLLVIFSYVLGYILRLSSPDVLDRKSAIKVIRGEFAKSLQTDAPLTIRDRIASLKDAPKAFKKWAGSLTVSWNDIRKWIKKDGWPFDPSNPKDKYPYLHFRKYLEKRGHTQLAEEFATWEPEARKTDIATQSVTASEGKPLESSKQDGKKQRSKSTVNMMKMSIRLYCPELSSLVESKEAHIRLMAGTWTAFKFSQWPIWIALIFLAAAGFAPQWLESILSIRLMDHNYFVYMFINLNLLMVIFFCNQRIEKLFHYRRVSELFHIVQAAYFAQQKSVNSK